MAEQNNILSQDCSLDVVQLDSSDEEFEYDPLTSKFVTKDETVSFMKGTGASLSQSSLQKDALEDEDDIDSEEEKDILKGIKDEIEGKVREEMKEELAMYQSKLLALESGQLSGGKNDEQAEVNEEEHQEMDPKLKEAIVKMQKLDRILRKKIKRERRVKRDRLLLERKLKEEISAMEHGASNYKEIKTNTAKFLALEPPPSHNDGITLDFEEEEDIPPLFQTQIDDCEIRPKGKRRDSGKEEPDKQTSSRSESKMSGDEAKNRTDSSASGEGKMNKNSNKNFIKRNKELAGAANEVIAMTEDEKKRLQDLLGDIDELDELDATFVDGEESSVFQLALNPGDGFIPDDIELKSLTNIDEKLRSIMPEDDFMSISGPGNSQFSTPRPALFTRVGIKSNLLDGFGEHVLYETKEERDLKARLESIEKKLEKFKSPTDGETDRSVEQHLSDEQLDELLNQCVRSMSRTSVMETPESTARSEMSSRQMMMENPPKLSEDQLQQLLSEAYFPMSSKLLALNEEAEDGESIISAEAWKAIVNQNLDNEGNPESVHQNISQNAHIDGKEGSDDGSYKCDNLLLGKEELSEEIKQNESSSSQSIQNHNLSNQKSFSKDFGKFPKISKTNGLRSTRHSVNGGGPNNSNSVLNENTNHGGSSIFNKRDVDPETLESNDQLRLPDIPSNSFLIHTSQGLNNKSSSSMPVSQSLSKEPISMVRNNLSDMSLTSFSEENFDPTQNHQKSSNVNDSNNFSNLSKENMLQPRPPSTSQ